MFLQLQVRSATRLTVLIVCSFLISNALNVAFTVMEFWDLDLLMETDYFKVSLITCIRNMQSCGVQMWNHEQG